MPHDNQPEDNQFVEEHSTGWCWDDHAVDKARDNLAGFARHRALMIERARALGGDDAAQALSDHLDDFEGDHFAKVRRDLEEAGFDTRAPSQAA